MVQVCSRCHLPLDPAARNLELGGVVLRMEAGELVHRNKAAKLKPAHVSMLAMMMRNAGEASRNALLRTCRSTTGPKTVDVQICLIRRAFKDAGMALRIDCERGIYRLEEF